MIYPIVFDPEKILHEPSALVPHDDIVKREMQKFTKDMIETMYVKNGVGLAAVQVGKPIQLFTLVKAYNDLNKHEDLVLFNPTYKKLSIKTITEEEGCLSIPGYYGQRKRYAKIAVNGTDKNGKLLSFTAEGFFARIIQHEIDHLNGHLYIEKAAKVRKVD